jgi:flagellin-like hook-associated protein FlgL
MAFGDISLTASMRNVLVSLQQNNALLDRTSERLSTGKRVNSALDNPANFFAAKGHTDRASQLDARKDAMSEAIQTIKAADNGIKGITSIIENLRGVITAARSSSTGATQAQVDQFTELKSQLDSLAGDASYKGINLLDGDDLTVTFNEDGTSSLTVSGATADSSAGGLNIGTLALSDGDTELNTLEDSLNDALTELRDISTSLSSNLGVVQARLDFTTDLINTLVTGATKLTAADTNEEGANLLIQQTRLQLGTSSLSIASQAAQSVLRLF